MKSSNESNSTRTDILEQYMTELAPKFSVIDLAEAEVTYNKEKQKELVLQLDRVQDMIQSTFDDDSNEEVLIFIEDTKNVVFKLTVREVKDRLKSITAMGYQISLRLGEKILNILA